MSSSPPERVTPARRSDRPSADRGGDVLEDAHLAGVERMGRRAREEEPGREAAAVRERQQDRAASWRPDQPRDRQPRLAEHVVDDHGGALALEQPQDLLHSAGGVLAARLFDHAADVRGLGLVRAPGV
jgi:hypothetical protein